MSKLCKKFDRDDILCCHAMKVLDREDVKAIPPRYILHRWTRAAKEVEVVDKEGRNVLEDVMLEIRNRNANLFRLVTPTFNILTRHPKMKNKLNI